MKKSEELVKELEMQLSGIGKFTGKITSENELSGSITYAVQMKADWSANGGIFGSWTADKVNYVLNAVNLVFIGEVKTVLSFEDQRKEFGGDRYYPAYFVMMFRLNN